MDDCGRPDRQVFDPASRAYPAAAPFEFTISTKVQQHTGAASRGACIGGGAAAFRIAENWQILGDVSGCKMTDFGANLSGDSLTYLIGPRWTANPAERWTPYAQVLFGGMTLTHEEIDPAKRAQLEAIAAPEGSKLGFADHGRYSRHSEITRFGASAAAGVDVKLTDAIAMRVADLEYLHSWNSSLNGIDYSNSLRFSAGLVLRFGTW